MKKIFENEVLKLKDKPYVDKNTVDEFLKRIGHGKLTKSENSSEHLCSFFLPINIESNSVFIGHHKKADSWIPPGGHIEPEESPVDAMKREFKEELRITLTTESITLFNLSSVQINNPGVPCKTHYDFWYLVESPLTNFNYDRKEFYDARWINLKEAIDVVSHPVYKPIFMKLKNSWRNIKD